MKFFPVITKRDYIKTEKDKVYLWELLDIQPKGFLTSLGTQTNLSIPSNYKVFYDCGAYSYKNEDVPPIDAKNAYEKYFQIAKTEDLVTSPDHMLIKNCNIKKRMEFNKKESEIFINLVSDKFIPIATIHGTDVKKQLQYGKYLTNLGYKHLAIGGLAIRAKNKNYVTSTVETIRNKFPDVYIHVFGISAPYYVEKWKELKINSFDGSSYFMKALTKGLYVCEDMTELKAGSLNLPSCNCKSCQFVKDLGEDTRLFGNSTRNIGRAIHNLNMLMRNICI